MKPPEDRALVWLVRMAAVAVVAILALLYRMHG